MVNKKYGVRITLPEGDPMAAPHLLGEDWAATRWFETPEERDAWIEQARREHLYSRRGDVPTQRYEKVEGD